MHAELLHTLQHILQKCIARHCDAKSRQNITCSLRVFVWPCVILLLVVYAYKSKGRQRELYKYTAIGLEGNCMLHASGPKAMNCCGTRNDACICHEHALNQFSSLPDPESNAANSLIMLSA